MNVFTRKFKDELNKKRVVITFVRRTREKGKVELKFIIKSYRSKSIVALIVVVLSNDKRERYRRNVMLTP